MGIVHQIWKISAVALVVFICSGCAAVNNRTTTIKPSPLSSYSADPNSEVGSRSNPIALGDVALVNNWRVQVISVNKNAMQLVMASDSYASSISPEQRCVLLKIKATYIGDESGEPWGDLKFKIVGSGGNTFNRSCGYSADTFTENGEAYTGASVTGNLGFIVDANQISGATVSIQGDYSTEDRQFISID